jgi:hypothetical protein
MANQFSHIAGILDTNKQTILDSYNSGTSCKNIAKAYSVCQETIRRFLIASGVSMKPGGDYPRYKTTQLGKKVCCKCGLPQDITEFGKDHHSGDGLRYHCNTCDVKRQRHNAVLRYYDDPEQYDTIFAEQGGVCACCGQPETAKLKGKIKLLAVDHNHKTGKIRQLLCQRCNLVIGLVNEDPDLCELLKQYALRIRKEG